jgi:hypothetical protein
MVDIAVLLELALPIYFALAPLVDLATEARLLAPAAAHPLAEPFDRTDIHSCLAEVLARDVDLGLLTGAAERDVGVLAVAIERF